MNLAATWLRRNGWKAFDFQKEVWQAVADGQSGLVHASTGAGKTYAVWLAALNRFAVSYTHLTLPTKRIV